MSTDSNRSNATATKDRNINKNTSAHVKVAESIGRCSCKEQEIVPTQTVSDFCKNGLGS